MEVTLGPWEAAKTIEAAQRPLADAMGDEAFKTVEKNKNFTPIKANGRVDKGYGISGRLTKVFKEGAMTHVVATYSVTVDGRFSNIAISEGRAAASGRWGAEEALRSTTESKVKQILDAIKAGRVVRQG